MKLILLMITLISFINGNHFFLYLIFLFTELKLLHLQSKISVRHAFAEGTNQNLKIQWETYFMFCFYFGFQSLRSSVKVLT